MLEKQDKHSCGPEKEQKYTEVRKLGLAGPPNRKSQRLPGIQVRQGDGTVEGKGARVTV